MTLKEVRERAGAVIGNTSHGPQRHADEDALFEDVLAAIASGACEGGAPAEFAAEALKTTPGRFDTWYE